MWVYLELLWVYVVSRLQVWVDLTTLPIGISMLVLFFAGYLLMARAPLTREWYVAPESDMKCLKYYMIF